MKKEFLLTCAAIAAITTGATTPTIQADDDVALEPTTEATGVALAPTYDGESSKYAMYVIQNAVYAYTAPNGYAYGNNYHLAFVPAYTDITFVNKSTASPTTWTYSLDGKTTLSSTDKNLVLNLEPLKEYNLPHLEIDSTHYYTPVNDSRQPSEELSKLHVGGTALDTSWKPNAARFPNVDSTMYMFGADLTQCTRAKSGSAYISYFPTLTVNPTDTTISPTTLIKSIIGSNVTKVARSGVAQRFPALGADYLIKDITFSTIIPYPDSVDAGAVISGKIYTFEGNTTAKLNSSLTEIGEFSYTNPTKLKPLRSGAVGYVRTYSTPVRHNASKVDNGIVVPADKQILVTLEKFEGLTYVCPIFFFYPESNISFYTNNAYLKYDAANGKSCYVPCTSISETAGYPYNAQIGINVEFDYLHFDETTVTLPADGNEVIVSDCNTYHNASEWTIAEDTNGTGVVAGWLKYKISEGTDAHHPLITFSADKATAARETTFTIIGPSATDAVLTVKQPEAAGVNAVTTNAVKVSNAGENFQVTVPEYLDTVAIYNLNGQLVTSQSLTTGANTINASSLASGVYVLKFNNGITVKAIK